MKKKRRKKEEKKKKLQSIIHQKSNIYRISESAVGDVIFPPEHRCILDLIKYDLFAQLSAFYPFCNQTLQESKAHKQPQNARQRRC